MQIPADLAAAEHDLTVRLISSGRLTQEQLGACLEIQRTHGGPTAVRLAQVLVDSGLVSATEVQGYLTPAVTARFDSDQPTSISTPPPPHPTPHGRPMTSAAGAEHLPDEVRQAMADPARHVGRYVVLSMLGRGGMGIVYRGYDPQLCREVAIKMIATEKPDDEDMVRFIREARACAKLRHPCIIAVHEVGEHQGQPYLVMDLVKGQTLEVGLKGKGLSPRKLVSVSAEIANALEHAHSAGIIHRDVKPENIIITEDGRPLLMDFGLARETSVQQQYTKTGQMLGTPLYMAPEQIQGAGLGPWTDVYALGALLYHGLTGTPPFRSSNPAALFRAILVKEPRSPRAHNAAITPDLETLILKCLEKEPNRRYPTASALAQDLQLYLDGRAIVARPIGLSGHAIRWVRRNRALSAALMAVAMVVAVATAVVVDQEATARKAQEDIRRLEAAVRDQGESGETREESTVVETEPSTASEEVSPDSGEQASAEVREPSETPEPLVNTSEPMPALPAVFEKLRRADLCQLRGVLGRRTWMHRAMVTCVAWSPNGRLAVSGSLDHSVGLWDTKTGQEVGMRSLGAEILCVAFAADGKRVAVGTRDRKLRVIEVTTGRMITRQGEGDVLGLAFLAPDRIVMSSSAGLGV